MSNERKETFEVMGNLAKAVNHYGVGLDPFTSNDTRTLEDRLKNVSRDEFIKAKESMDIYLNIIEPNRERNKNLPPLQRDLEQLKEFFAKRGLKLKDEGFLNVIEDGDLIEVYSLNHQQIFRNVSFFDFCNYSLETLTFISWAELFYRDQKILEVIFKTLGQVVEEEVGLWKKPPIPEHLLSECYQDADEHFVYKMKNVGCVLDEELGKSMGYISTLQIDPVDKSNLQHLGS